MEDTETTAVSSESEGCVWQVDEDATLQTMLESEACVPLLRQTLTGALSWHVRNRRPLRRALISPAATNRLKVRREIWAISQTCLGVSMSGKSSGLFTWFAFWSCDVCRFLAGSLRPELRHTINSPVLVFGDTVAVSQGEARVFVTGKLDPGL